MLRRRSELAYQAASASGATQLGLLTLVYAALANDLRLAGDSVKRGDIAARCAASNHALTLLGHLESWDFGNKDSELTRSLAGFYHHLRNQILALQTERSNTNFHALAELVLNVRSTWQQKEQELILEQQQGGAFASSDDASASATCSASTSHGWCV